jgi:hypothetical protein
VDAAQGPVAGKDVLDHRGEGGKAGAFADDQHFGSHRASQGQGAAQQGLAVKFHEGLVGAHAAALAAGQDEGGEVRGGLGHANSVAEEAVSHQHSTFSHARSMLEPGFG